MNTLYLGDNLEIMKAMSNESVDLIYLDPPFFSNRTYEVIWGDKGVVRSFEDRWAGGVDHYIGAHAIAIKAVDNEGLEGQEILRLKVNGAIERV